MSTSAIFKIKKKKDNRGRKSCVAKHFFGLWLHQCYKSYRCRTETRIAKLLVECGRHSGGKLFQGSFLNKDSKYATAGSLGTASTTTRPFSISRSYLIFWSPSLSHTVSRYAP